MLFFMINLAFANPNEEQPQKSAVETSQATNEDAEFDFLTEKKEIWNGVSLYYKINYI